MDQNNIQIIQASTLQKDIDQEVTTIFIDGFYQWFTYFSKDKNKLIKAFSNSFNLSSLFIALKDNKVVAITACSNNNTFSIKLNKKRFKKNLGFIKGSIAYMILHKEFEKNRYPFDLNSNIGSIEFVAVCPKYRKQNIASTIINYIIDNTNYKEYVLEVADNNIAAIKLYEKIGFKEFMKVKQKNSKKSGIDNLLYMKKIK